MPSPPALRGTLALAVSVACTTHAFGDPATPLDFRFDPGATPTLALALQDEDGAVELDPAVAPPAGDEARPLGNPRRVDKYGVEGQTWWHLSAGYGSSVKDSDDTVAPFALGVSHFIADDLAIVFEFNGLWITQFDGGVDEDIFGANFNVLFQWHFVNRRNWSLFLDGGAGVLVTTNEVPRDGSSFNFTPQAGVGFTRELARGARLLGGVRWHHISNANTFDDNPGRDSIMGWVGLQFPF